MRFCGWACVPTTTRRALQLLGALVVPVECPGCGRWDVPWCSACCALLTGPLCRRDASAPRLDRLDGTGPMPVWSAAEYRGPVRGIVVAWKDLGRADLDPVVGEAMRIVGQALAGTVARAADGPVVVVPAPSSRAATHSRGRHVVAGLARSLAEGLSSGGCAARVDAVLVQRRSGDQVGRGIRGRGARLGGVGRRPRSAVEGTCCLLVDDVLTTGATLAACEDALLAGGGRVLGAVVVAATPAPGRASAAVGGDVAAVSVSEAACVGLG